MNARQGRDLGDGHVKEERDVTVVEVGPRDGLQNEVAPVPTAIKVAFVDALSVAGLPVIETTSFVSPKAVPQLADAAELMRAITRKPGVRYPVLVPNEQGLIRAMQAGADAFALFTSATEEFAQANVRSTIAGTFERFAPVASTAKRHGFWMRGYVSVAFGCPYAGAVTPAAVVAVSEALLNLGCDEICLADTIGVATPALVDEVVAATQQVVPNDRLALHFHDTTGQAIANVEAALNLGVRTFDAAAGGLGGCPFAPGAPGNLSTGPLLDRLHNLGLRTSVSPDAVAAAVDLLRGCVPRLSETSA